MSDKALAYVVSVKALDTIEGKDRIVLARFNESDWTVIASKEDFNVGDKAVYVEVNSVLPEKPEFDFLRKRCYSEKRRGFVIRTMKMSGVLSQGILFSFSQLGIEPASVGTNLTEKIGVKAIDDEVPRIERAPKSKWEAFIDKWFYKIFKRHLIKKVTGNFPIELINKTDETQVQSLNYVYDEWKGKRVYSTVKVDGSSLTVIIHKGRFIVASRNVRLFEANIKVAAAKLNPNTADKCGDVWTKAVALADLPAKFKPSGFTEFALQAEICGPGIQKNRLGLKEIQTFVFNMYDVAKKAYYTWDFIERVCEAFDLQTVPFIEKRVFDFENLDDLRKYAVGSYENGHPREGVVIRLLPESGIYVPPPSKDMSNMASLKIINEEFRLKVEQ
jgi:tRNA-binding EMAP/Myf-like protein